MTTALIIDDNDLNLESLRVLLKREGVGAIAVLLPNSVRNNFAFLHQSLRNKSQVNLSISHHDKSKGCPLQTHGGKYYFSDLLFNRISAHSL